MRAQHPPRHFLIAWPGFVFLLIIFGCSCLPARAQQPFVTDDADVTPRHKLHFEFSNEFDWLQRSAFPSLRQNTADFELDYGLFENVEIGFESPVLTIVNDRSGPFRSATGIGDSNISLKYNFLKEREGSRRPALAIVLNLELPTGDTSRQLGSGLSDFNINGILQKSITKKTVFRFNSGVLFSGNETTGELGLRARGLVLTGGASLVRSFTPKLDLGVEVNGARAKNADLGKGRLMFSFGGNYGLSDKMSFDFALVAGRFTASPRVGVQVGISVDF